MDADRKSTRLNSSHTVIYTLSLHDALPISRCTNPCRCMKTAPATAPGTSTATNCRAPRTWLYGRRSEEHTSELQSHSDLHSFPTRRSSDLALHESLPLYEDGPGNGTWNFNRYQLPRAKDVAVWT